MSRDGSTRPDRPEDDAFSNALDDLFGAAQGEPELPPEQTSHVPHAMPPEPQSVQTSPSVEPAWVDQYYPRSRPVAPPLAPREGRSFTRTLGMGCAGILTLLFVCMIALMVIGWLTGDTSTST